MSQETPLHYNDILPLRKSEAHRAMIFCVVPSDLNLAGDTGNLEKDREKNKEKLKTVVLRFPNTNLWAGTAVTAALSLVPAMVVAPTAVALTQGALALGLSVVLSARNSAGKAAHHAHQQYIEAYASVSEKVKHKDVQEKYLKAKQNRDRHLLFGQVLLAGAIVSTGIANAHTVGSALLMTASALAFSKGFVDHIQQKWASGKSMQMAETIALRRGELVAEQPKSRTSPTP